MFKTRILLILYEKRNYFIVYKYKSHQRDGNFSGGLKHFNS